MMDRDLSELTPSEARELAWKAWQESAKDEGREPSRGEFVRWWDGAEA